MTKKELGEKLIETKEQEQKEIDELNKRGKLIGLDGPVTKKYREKRKALFAEYEKNKDD